MLSYIPHPPDVSSCPPSLADPADGPCRRPAWSRRVARDAGWPDETGAPSSAPCPSCQQCSSHDGYGSVTDAPDPATPVPVQAGHPPPTEPGRHDGTEADAWRASLPLDPAGAP